MIAAALPTSRLETNEAPPPHHPWDWPDFDCILNRRSVTPSVQGPAAQGAGTYEVIDGDTICAPYGVKCRLLGFDAPETFQALCDAELALARRATKRLKNFWRLASRVIESGKIDRYGRTLAHLTVNSRDVGGTLIGEGLARPYNGGRRQGWCG